MKGTERGDVPADREGRERRLPLFSKGRKRGEEKRGRYTGGCLQSPN